MLDLLFDKISVLDPIDGERRNVCLGVRGDKIAYLGEGRPEEPAARTIGGTDRLLIPGLKNTHTHIAMTALRGVSDDQNLNDWLFGSVIPVENRMTGEMVDISARMGLLEAAAGGTTGICDMYGRAPQLARSAKEMGMRAAVGNVPLCTENFTAADRSVTETEQLLAEFSDDALITPTLGVHSVHTTYPAVWKWVTDVAARRPMLLNMHMAEARQDVEECRRLYGDTPAAVLAANGLFAGKALIAHGVWVDERDLSILEENGAALAHCPVSNLKLASGIAPVTEYVKHGIPVTLGTDGVASNNSLDMFEEMKYAALLQKYRTNDAGALTARDVFRFATVNACRVLGWETCGRILEGWDADLCMLSLDRPGLAPQRDLLSNVVYCANAQDVRLTMTRGRILYEDGNFPSVDQEKIVSEFRRIMPLLQA